MHRTPTLALAALACTTGLLAPLAPTAEAAPAAPQPSRTAPRAEGWRSSPVVRSGEWAGARVQARMTSLGAAFDRSYGPIEKIDVELRNTGTKPTRYLDVQTPSGEVYLDDEGEQMFIGNCRPKAMPLRPGTATTCTMYRRLSTAELETGRLQPQRLVVVTFGDKGPKVTGLRTGAAAFDADAVHARRVEAHVATAGVRKDSSYGPVEVFKVDVKNTGWLPTRYLDLQTPDGKVYLDAEGEQMFIGNCTTALPLAPGRSTTCDAYRRLEAAETRTGCTTPQQLVVAVFGADGPRVTGLSTGSFAFDPRSMA
ncbi:hypothetical protein [Luteococcus peritonei]|uniref:DUF4352 domain-containing protein n=1 Tax=Luteococcus peritonei TaxID=88874 RepID=A0ABW4RTF1_9ACTN